MSCFCQMPPPPPSIENAVAISERIRRSVEESPFMSELGVTCSFGVVPMKEKSSFNTLLREADRLMYDVKRQGKNSIKWVEQ